MFWNGTEVKDFHYRRFKKQWIPLPYPLHKQKVKVVTRTPWTHLYPCFSWSTSPLHIRPGWVRSQRFCTPSLQLATHFLLPNHGEPAVGKRFIVRHCSDVIREAARWKQDSRVKPSSHTVQNILAIQSQHASKANCPLLLINYWLCHV